MFPENLCTIFLSLLFNAHHLCFMCRFQEDPRNDYTGCKGQVTGRVTRNLELTAPSHPHDLGGTPQPNTQAHTHSPAPDGLAGAWLAQPELGRALPCGSPRQVPALAPTSLALRPAWSRSCRLPGPGPVPLSQAGQTAGLSCSACGC